MLGVEGFLKDCTASRSFARFMAPPLFGCGEGKVVRYCGCHSRSGLCFAPGAYGYLLHVAAVRWAPAR